MSRLEPVPADLGQEKAYWTDQKSMAMHELSTWCEEKKLMKNKLNALDRNETRNLNKMCMTVQWRKPNLLRRCRMNGTRW